MTCTDCKKTLTCGCQIAKHPKTGQNLTICIPCVNKRKAKGEYK